MNSSRKFTLGFTLIELLVIVAIIGILASVVMVLSGNARTKGADAAIKSQMKSLQNQVEIIFIGSYATAFTNVSPYWFSDNTQIQALLTSIDKQTTVHTAYSTASAWAAQARLVQNTANYFCVDASGKGSTSSTPMAAGGTVCPP